MKILTKYILFGISILLLPLIILILFRPFADYRSNSSIENKFVTKSGDYDFTIQQGETTRYYKVYVPASYDKNNPTPLVFAFHGGLGNGEGMSQYYNFVEESDNKKFIVVFPTGASKFGNKLATWNAGTCCSYSVKNNSDDVGFVRKILEDVKNKFNIDGNRIYATGMSNGGMFSYRLACEMSDEFAAIASVAGTKNTISCSPSKPIAILHIHAINDNHVLFEGGCGPDCTAGVNYTSVPDTIEWWAKKNQCTKEKIRVFENNGAYCDSYNNCTNNSEVKLCVTSEGGHSWSGGQKPRSFADTPSASIDATKIIWEFFENHPMK